MPRYIDADALIDFLDVGHLRHPSELCFSEVDVANLLLHAPTISPDEVRGVGEWIMLENQSKEDTDNGNYWYTCSHCSAGDLHAKVQEVPFCWKCGARMKGVSGDA